MLPPFQTSSLTPAFRWNDKANRYVNASGRFVKRAEVVNALEAVTQGAKGEMTNLSKRLAGKQISLADWQVGMRGHIKAVHNAQAAIAKGGWAQMTPSDWGRVGSITKKQYAFLQNFALEIESGKQPLNGNFLRRAGMYADASRGTAADVSRIEAQKDGLTEERRIRFPGDSCPTCISQAELGWQPIGTLNRIGDSECRTNCRCEFDFR